MAGPVAPEEPEDPVRGPDEPSTTGVLAASFLQEVGREMRSRPLTAGALSRAAARLLPVDGAGISSLVDDLRLPLGASSAAVARAEELQTTLGDGPCLAATQTRAPCVVDLPDLLRRWPLYAEELMRQTPYRSAASIPLRTPDGDVFAALDLYSEDPRLVGRVDLIEVDVEIGASLGALLDLCMHPYRNAEAVEVLPEWYEDVTARRQDVCVATGMVMGREHQPGGDALSVPRGYAYSNERTLDAVADDLVHGRLKVRDLGVG